MITGVIGTGHLGFHHARILGEITGRTVPIFDTDTERMMELASRIDVRPVKQIDSLLEECDSVGVACTTSGHYRVVMKALGAGLNVLVEKPIAANPEEGSEMVELAEETDLILAVGHVERFNPAILAAAEFIDTPLFVEGHRMAPFNPRGTDVSVVMDLMIHDIDIILGLAKSKIAKIDAVGVKILTKHEDIANARIRFKNGIVCDLTASRVTNDSLRKIRIFQKDCYISLDYVTQEAIISRKIKNKIISQKIDIKKEHPLKKELASFVDCVLKKKRPLVSGIEAYNALLVAHKIIKKLNLTPQRC